MVSTASDLIQTTNIQLDMQMRNYMSVWIINTYANLLQETPISQMTSVTVVENDAIS
jgi:hypothetical protein